MKKTLQDRSKKKFSVSSRPVVQMVFFIITVHIGIQFYLFVSDIEKGLMPNFNRPPGVEAFLPISALVSLKHFLITGTINTIHPSALVLFVIICATALIAKKGFCSWICPIGMVSETLAKLHLPVFKKRLVLPGILDVPLRGIKYLPALFFIWSIFFQMPAGSVENFIQSPYNRFADIKMLHFFTRISNTALAVILCLIVLSFLFQYFWCRYLCPYGAILGMIGFLSVGKIKRHASQCNGCGKCESVCPGVIQIRQTHFVTSPECTACMECVKHCPEKNAIKFSLFRGKLLVTPPALAIILVLLFTLGISLAKLSGNWQNTVSKSDYLRYGIQSNPARNHNGHLDHGESDKMIQLMKRLQEHKAQMIRPSQK